VDMHAAQALPQDLGDWKSCIEFVLGPYNCATDLDQVSVMDLGRADERDSAAFCRQGFGALLASLARGIPVRLDTPVTQIDTRSRGVQIRTASGTLTGRYAIVTAPAAVLAADKISFLPELPKRQRDAVTALKPGSLDHIALEMPGNPLGLQRDDLMFEKSADRQTAALLANVSATPLAVVTVGGRHGRELAAGGEKALVEFATDWLAGVYGEDVRKTIKRTRATNWGAAPWIMGAVATAGPGGQSSRQALNEPIRDRLYFAGEAAHETRWGTVGGAWESGERAAEAILRRLGAIKDPEESKPSRQRRPASRRRKRQ
jgi:monoamine oxidase